MQQTQLDRIEQLLHRIASQLQTNSLKETALMSEQDQVNAAASQIQADVAAEDTAIAASTAATQAIQAEIAALEAKIAAGTPVTPTDLTGLKAAVAQLDTTTASEQAAVAAEQGLVPPAPPAGP